VLSAAAQGEDVSKRQVLKSFYKNFTSKNMKIKTLILLLLAISFPMSRLLASDKIPYGNYSNPDVFVIQQIRFNPNNIDTWIINSGISDQDLRTTNTPGFQWPAGSGKFAVFTMGLTTGAMVNGGLRMASASYKGEYAPGHVVYSSGHPIAATDSTFRFYKVSRGDNMNNSYDWLVWGRMVPYGAPYTDVNHNNVYEPAVDTPGIRSAVQTIFICLTDGFAETHMIGEGFGGGTPPLYAELHFTAWGYDNPGLQDMIFKKFELINKNDTAWNSSYTAIVADPDLGFSDDDYIGCDTARNLGFCYNGDNDDAGNSYAYGVNPPAVGIKWLTCNGYTNIELSSFTYCTNTSTSGPVCEKDPNGEQIPAYYMLKGLKKDQTPWVIPPGGSTQYITKYCYTGDPEAGIGWNEGQPGNPHGSIQNCGGPNILSGTYVPVNPVGDRRMIMSSGAENNTIAPNDTVKLLIAELIARGTNNLNSVTKLKQLSDVAQHLCDSNFVIGIHNISSSIPNSYILYQNYPNPFNPATKIKFDLPKSNHVKLIIYDVLGREITVLVNQKQKAGSYEVDWDATNYPSGVYFYKLVTESYSETKKMVLLK
jgi:Secretion system C-terminal sorting domain